MKDTNARPERVFPTLWHHYNIMINRPPHRNKKSSRSSWFSSWIAHLSNRIGTSSSNLHFSHRFQNKKGWSALSANILHLNTRVLNAKWDIVRQNITKVTICSALKDSIVGKFKHWWKGQRQAVLREKK